MRTAARTAAVLTGKATITEITFRSRRHAGRLADRNATLRLAMTDGATETLGVTVLDKAGALWFSSNWNGKKTVEQALLHGGLIVVS